MKISYSNLHGDAREAVEEEAKHHLEKLERLLKRYAPDLVQIHGAIDKQAHKHEFSLSLNLTLPTGTLHATGVGPDPRASTKAAFAEIEQQVKKHQEKLRKDYMWKRKRGRAAPKLGEVPSAD